MEERRGMQGRYFHLARRIAEMASEPEGIDVRYLDDVLGFTSGEVNCYPGFPFDRCCSLAVFIALHGRLARTKWPLNFESMLQKFVQHMQGRCSGMTHDAVLITDSWWAKEYEQWSSNLQTIAQNSCVEMYLIGYPGWTVPVFP